MSEFERLESQLSALAPTVDYPPTPDLRTSVEGRIRQRDNSWRRLIAAAAALLLISALAASLLPPVRAVLADWLGFGRIRLEKVHRLPSPAPSPSIGLNSELHLGERVTLVQATALLGRPLLVPAELGEPDRVFWASATHFVSLVYLARPDLPETGQTGVAILVMEAPGDVQYPFLFKTLGPETRLEKVTVQGGQGGWIEGKPHEVAYLDSTGGFTTDPVRLAANVLIFAKGGMTYRVESSLPRDRVLAIANSLR